MGLDQHYGAQVPLDAQFQDESGKIVKFGDLLHGKPIMLLPMFFNCNGVCRLEIEDLFKTLEKDKNLHTGKDFDVVMLSINPTETPKIASAKKDLILSAYKVKGGDTGVHGLVGALGNIHKVTDAIGFRYTYNDVTQQINHPAGLIFLDPKGVVRGYIYGAEFPTVVLANNLKAASIGASPAEKPEIVLLGCVMIDPITHKKTVIIENLMKVIGSATALVLFGSIFHMSRKYKTPPIPADYQGGKTPGV